MIKNTYSLTGMVALLQGVQREPERNPACRVLLRIPERSDSRPVIKLMARMRPRLPLLMPGIVFHISFLWRTSD
jgi:hypothetical protein